MNRILFSCLLLALCIISTYAAAPPLPVCNHNPPNAYMVELPPNFIAAVQAFLPEGKPVSSALLSTKAWDPNFLFDFSDTPGFTEAYIDVSILWEGAGYRNQFGYFTYTLDNNGKAKVVKEVVVYDDVSFPDSGSDYKNNPACLQPGVSTRLGPFTQGQRVGWFCYPDRVRTNSHTTLYSEETLNKNEASGEVHVLVASLQDQYIVGIEDIAPLKNADRDYNDIVFKASTSKAGKITVPVIPADCKDPYCNGRGSCNKTTLTCNCATTSSTSYYTGDSCEIITPCTKPCGAGICTPSGCVCDPTRFSADCTACADGRYVFPTCDPCPKDCKKGCNPDGTCYIPPPPPPPNPPPTCLSKPFLIASDYQVFVSGAFTGVNSDITTRLAAGGDVTLTQYSLGEALALDDNFNCDSFGANDNKNTLVAGGNLNFDSGNVRVGNIIYGGNPAIGAGVSGSLASGCISAKGSVIDFASTFTWLNGLSRTFKNYGSNGKVYQDSLDSNKLVFQAPTSAPSNNNYVWNVDAATLSAAKSLTFLNVPTTAAILIINVASDKGRFTFSDASLELILTSGLSSRLIWNFYDTRSLTIQRIGLAGAILAPFAAVTGSDSVVWGNIFAASFSGSTQVNGPLENIQPCILSNIKIDVDDGSCPACIGDSVAGSGCKCTCPTLPKCTAPLVADPSGACQCVCNANPNCPLGVDANCNCITAEIPNLGGQCRQNPFGWLTDFQIATQGLTTISSAYIGGRAAAGGALSLTRVSLGLDLVKSPTDDCSVSGYSYVSAGAASVVAGNVVGNIAHGSSCQFSYSIAVPPFPRPAYCEFPLYEPALFQSGGKFSIGDAFGGTVIPISAALADPNAVPTTGIYVKSNDIITLFGANTAFEVFSIDATDLANTRRIDVRGLASASTIIINIVGSTSVSISKIGLQSLVPFSRLLIWNAPSATVFSATNVALPGFVLAPSASITNPVGQILGGVFASSFRAKGNIYLPWLGSFAGCIPNDLSSKACPACPAGSARQDTSCNCYNVVSLSAVVTNDFGFNTGYSVKYTVNNKHSKSLSAISVTFPQDPACPLQIGADGVTPQVFSLNVVAGAQYATPSWTGFSADGYSFIALYYSAAGTCNSKKPVVPTISSVAF